MRTFGRKLCGLILLSVLTGCVLFKSTPTPLPLMRTAIPDAATPSASSTATPPANALPVSPGPVEQQIVLESPRDSEAVGNPLTVRGSTMVMPFEGTLVVRIHDAQDDLITEVPIMAQGDLGGPATFDAIVAYGDVPGAGRVEVVEVSPYDGTDLAIASASVTLSGATSSDAIEMPAASGRVTLPVRVLARVGQPGEQVNVTLAWEDGTQLSQVVTLLNGRGNRGLLFTSLDWTADPRPPHPNTQRATLLVHDQAGEQLAQQSVVVLHPNDSDTLAVFVYWVRGDAVEPQQLRIPRTSGIGRASLEALLWGPVPGNSSGHTSAIPLPEEVIAHPAGPEWGERAQLNKLTIEDGVARVDFSRELLSNPGGATRMTLIRQQIEQTLLQFSTVDQVVVTVEGQTGRLEP